MHHLRQAGNLLQYHPSLTVLHLMFHCNIYYKGAWVFFTLLNANPTCPSPITCQFLKWFGNFGRGLTVCRVPSPPSFLPAFLPLSLSTANSTAELRLRTDERTNERSVGLRRERKPPPRKPRARRSSYAAPSPPKSCARHSLHPLLFHCIIRREFATDNTVSSRYGKVGHKLGLRQWNHEYHYSPKGQNIAHSCG